MSSWLSSFVEKPHSGLSTCKLHAPVSYIKWKMIPAEAEICEDTVVFLLTAEHLRKSALYRKLFKISIVALLDVDPTSIVFFKSW